jgi:hypothetical protein
MAWTFLLLQAVVEVVDSIVVALVVEVQAGLEHLLVLLAQTLLLNQDLV